MKNYHKDIGFPSTLMFPDSLVMLTYTKHALDRRQRDEKRLKLKVIPSIVRVHKDNIVEIHTEDDVNCKLAVVRTHYDFSRDITLVLDLIARDKAKVVTFWLNFKKDKHENFKRERYTVPENKPTDEPRND
jgi:hypothetical protein